MLHILKDIKGLKLEALDHQVGKILDIFFDDLALTIRYFVVDAGDWLHERDVLISTNAIKSAHPERGALTTNLTKKQIEDSPPLDSNPPVSRQYEKQLHRHYDWTPYWGISIDPGFGIYGVPSLGANTTWQSPTGSAPDFSERLKNGDPHLQSAKDTRGYKLRATDGEIGEVEDFLVDPETWQIKYLVVQTGHWFSSRKVVIDRSWINGVEWSNRDVSLGLSRRDVENAPPYSPETLGTTYESDLTIYYNGLIDRWRDAVSQTHTKAYERNDDGSDERRFERREENRYESRNQNMDEGRFTQP